MTRTYRDHPSFELTRWTRCKVGRKLRNKKKSKGHKTKNCWICW